MLVKDVPHGYVFVYKGQKFVKRNPTFRSHRRPFDVNATVYKDGGWQKVSSGWINEEADVVVLGTKQEMYEQDKALSRAAGTHY